MKTLILRCSAELAIWNGFFSLLVRWPCQAAASFITLKATAAEISKPPRHMKLTFFQYMPWEGICFEFKGSQVTSGHPGWLAYRLKLLETFLFNDVFLLRLLRNVASLKFLFVENLFYNLYLISLPLKPFNQHVCVTGLKISAGAPSAEAKMFWIWHTDTLQITV